MSPVISATPIRHPRRSYRCETCAKPIEGAHLRLYGMAHEGDPPYVIRLHSGCAYPTDPKTGKALAALEIPARAPQEGTK